MFLRKVRFLLNYVLNIREKYILIKVKLFYLSEKSRFLVNLKETMSYFNARMLNSAFYKI